jgi:hypothetical protein
VVVGVVQNGGVVVVAGVVEVEAVDVFGVVVVDGGVVTAAAVLVAAVIADVFVEVAQDFAMVLSVLLVLEFYLYFLELCPFHWMPMVVGDQICDPS